MKNEEKEGWKDGDGWDKEGGGGVPMRNDNGAECAETWMETGRCHRRCSRLVTGITVNVTAPAVGQWASVSDLIGPGSETDGLFSGKTGSCSEGPNIPWQPWTRSPSPSLHLVRVHICVRGSCVCWGVDASSDLTDGSCVSAFKRPHFETKHLPPVQTSYWEVKWQEAEEGAQKWGLGGKKKKMPWCKSFLRKDKKWWGGDDRLGWRD